MLNYVVVQISDLATPAIPVCLPDSKDWEKEWKEAGDFVKIAYERWRKNVRL